MATVPELQIQIRVSRTFVKERPRTGMVPDRDGHSKTLHLQSDPVRKVRWFDYRVYASHGTRTEARRTFIPGWGPDMSDLTQLLRIAGKIGAHSVVMGPTRIQL